MRIEKFDFDDILIEPSVYTDINSRSTITIRDNDGMLPLFTSPMDTVIDDKNANIFIDNGIRSILPRTSIIDDYSLNNKHKWFSYSLIDFERIFIGNKSEIQVLMDNGDIDIVYALIDIANGHILHLRDVIRKCKEQYGDKVILMVGNVANPNTYENLSNAGADYIRIGIGNGGGCHFSGTRIKTIDGYKNIEDIEIGDIVLTHKGNYKEVKLLHELKSDNNYLLNDNKVTCNHEYYVVHNKYKNIITDENIHEYAQWIRVDELTKDYFLLEMV